jgi:hypothetical protein
MLWRDYFRFPLSSTEKYEREPISSNLLRNARSLEQKTQLTKFFNLPHSRVTVFNHHD